MAEELIENAEFGKKRKNVVTRYQICGIPEILGFPLSFIKTSEKAIESHNILWIDELSFLYPYFKIELLNIVNSAVLKIIHCSMKMN